MIDSVKLQLLVGEVVGIARDTGYWIQAERDYITAEKIEKKGLNDLVSYVDKGSEQRIVHELNRIFPQAGFIVEENTRSDKQDYNWIVDPLDGTTNFVHGIPAYAISIALEYKGEIILGVVQEISRDESFYAVKGGGSYLNSRSIRVSQHSKIEDSLFATGFPVNNFDRLDPHLQSVEHFIRNSHGVRRMGAAAVDLCFVACGRMDAFFEYNLNAWDVAAGALIVREAGGTVTDFKYGENWLFGREIAASNSHLHSSFLSSLKF